MAAPIESKHLYSIKSSLNFIYPGKQPQYLYLIPQFSHFLSSCPYLRLILWIPSERLLARFDIGLAINLTLSISYNM